MESIFKYSLIKYYPSIFKAGVILFGIALTGWVQIYPKIHDIGIYARKIEYYTEEKLSIKIKDIDCNSLKSNVADCKFARYNYLTNQNAMTFHSTWLVSFLFFGLGLIILSIYGFILAVKKEYKLKYAANYEST